MKTKITLCALLLIAGLYTKAQTYVTIPDPNFVNWLTYSYFGTCMNGNQMDITCDEIVNANSLMIVNTNISDLSGIEYFTHLQYLQCHDIHLTNLPALPDSLQVLRCKNNQLTALPALPNTLIELSCENNLLTSFPALPNSLKYIECRENQLTNLPALPDSVINLFCSNNQLTSIPALPNTITFFLCDNNQLTSLPTLPDSLKILLCNNNLLTNFPALPNSLQQFNCSFNQLTALPVLPNSLWYVWCQNNLLTSLPVLPDPLQDINCSFNQLTSLPALPDSLTGLECNNNLLTSLPALPDLLYSLKCNNNNISCLPVLPNNIYESYFNIDSNAFTCLPNYISAMDAATLAYPLCVQGDLVNNPNKCESASGIAGYIYKDINTNCLKDTGDFGLINVPIKLYDSNNNLVSQMSSFTSGVYYFELPVDTYTVSIDTAGMSFEIQCTNPGNDSTVALTSANPLVADVNFNLVCKPGFDLGVQSVVTTAVVFPGQQHTLKVVAGEMGNWYNLNCTTGLIGQVLVTAAGPVTYIGPALGALTPMVTGGQFVYSIADFGNINNSNDFGLVFKTDTTAQAGDTICVNVTITPTSGDINVNNNTYSYCYQVVNSYDPNMKEVYPVDVLPGYEDYFTYTIHFQNTGSAPAINIFLIDTLSNYLDLETFNVINYSHNNIASLAGKILTFRIPDIMLPDSTNDEPGSKGFVQYRIKPKSNLAAGTQIENTAYIYFDFNAPIATNTTVNEFKTLSIEEKTSSSQLSIFPNPVKDNATITFSSPKAQHIQINLYDMVGQKILFLNQNVDAGANNIQINTQSLTQGFYMLSVRDEGEGTSVVKFVK